MGDSRGFAAAIQNRANEIGIAYFEESGLELKLTQFVETSRTYCLALTELLAADPACILLVGTAHGEAQETLNRAVSAAVADFGLGCEVRKVGRAAFDDTRGRALVQQFARSKRERRDEETNAGNYLAFGAAGEGKNWGLGGVESSCSEVTCKCVQVLCCRACRRASCRWSRCRPRR